MYENNEERIIDPTNQLRRAFYSPLFLTLCILVSVVTFFELMAGSINPIYILVTIGSWLVYASALRGGRLDHSGLAIISGTAKAMKILCIVLAIILLVCTAVVIVTGIFSVTTFSIEYDTEITVRQFFDMLQNELINENPTLDLNAIGFYEFRDAIIERTDNAKFSISGVILASFVISSVVMAVVGALLLVMGLTFYKTLHTFHKSVCLNAQNGLSGIKKANSLRVWLMVIGILSAIGSIPLSINPITLSSLASAGVYIVGSVFVSKYFCTPAEKTANNDVL